MAEWRRAHKVDELVRTFEFPELPAVREQYPHFYHKVCAPCRTLTCVECARMQRAHAAALSALRMRRQQRPCSPPCPLHTRQQTDKWGRPVYYELVGRIDVSKVQVLPCACAVCSCARAAATCRRRTQLSREHRTPAALPLPPSHMPHATLRAWPRRA